MSSSYLRRIYLRLAGVIMVAVIAALVANAFLSHRAFEQALAPEMSRKAAVVGASIRSLILKAVEHQIEFAQLHGIEQKFEEVRAETPEISYFGLTDAGGRLLHEYLRAPEGAAAHFRQPKLLAALADPAAVPPAVRVGDQYIVSLPIANEHGMLGMLHIGLGVSFVDDIVLEMLYDVLVVLVVSLFFTLELLNFMAGAKLEASLKHLGEVFERGAAGRFFGSARRNGDEAFASVLALLEGTLQRVGAAYGRLQQEIEAARHGPRHERPPALAAAAADAQALGQRFSFARDAAEAPPRAGQLARVRAPLFVFILAEELTRPFLPSFVGALPVPFAGLSPEIVVGLPIALFMLIVALSQPWLGMQCDRHGAKRNMNLGAAIAGCGFLGSALAPDVATLLAARSACAFGYAMMFVAAQAYVLEHADPRNRAKSFSLFVGAIMVASICGPSIGGILADNIGPRQTFVVAALLAFGSLAAIRPLPADGERAAGAAAARMPRWSEIATLLTNRRFMTVTGLAAMPAKMLLTGGCFYLVPMAVMAAGGSQAMAGRILMTYAVLMVLAAPLSAALAVTRERMEWLVGGGLVVSGLGGLVLLSGDAIGWLFVAVTLIGLGQSLSISAQSALVGEHCRDEIAAVGEGAVYGVYRLLERLGNAVGPMIAAVLTMRWGEHVAFVALGGFVLACGALFLLLTRRLPEPLPSVA